MKMILWAFVPFTVLSFGLPLPCIAQQTEDTPIEFEVLQQKVVQQGGRTVTYNIVQPPVLQARPVQPPAEVAPLTELELAALQAEAEKPVKTLIVEGTAYSNGITDFRWSDSGHAYRAFSNTDMTVFPAMTILSDQNAVYQLMFLVSTSTGEVPAEIPAPSQFSSEHSEYLLTSNSEAEDPDASALAGFDALHVYYDAKKVELTAQKAARVAAQAAHEQERRDHPPQPKDITINFWPESGSIFLAK